MVCTHTKGLTEGYSFVAKNFRKGSAKNRKGGGGLLVWSGVSSLARGGGWLGVHRVVGGGGGVLQRGMSYRGVECYRERKLLKSNRKACKFWESGGSVRRPGGGGGGSAKEGDGVAKRKGSRPGSYFKKLA